MSSQRDSERALIAEEAREQRQQPEFERTELIGMLRERGLSAETAAEVAEELHGRDALRAHLNLELGIDQEDLTNPWAAAAASAVTFAAGASLPLIAILVPPASARIPVASAAVLCALVVTAVVSAHLGHASRRIAVARLVTGGALAMAVTFAIGQALGVAAG